MRLNPAAKHWSTLAVVVVAADLATKQLAVKELREPVQILPGLDLRLGYNPGVAFGALTGVPPWLLVGTVVLLIGGLLVSVWTGLLSPPWPAVGLLLGGAVANLVDRAADGRVTDFIDPSRWPAFNLADVAITVGVAALVVAGVRDDQGPGEASSAPT